MGCSDFQVFIVFLLLVVMVFLMICGVVLWWCLVRIICVVFLVIISIGEQVLLEVRLGMIEVLVMCRLGILCIFNCVFIIVCGFWFMWQVLVGWKMVVLIFVVVCCRFFLLWYFGLGLYFCGWKVVSVGVVVMWWVRCMVLVVIFRLCGLFRQLGWIDGVLFGLSEWMCIVFWLCGCRLQIDVVNVGKVCSGLLK